MHHWYITKKTRLNEYDSINNNNNDTQNTVLLKVIQMYLDQVVKLRIHDANLKLTSMNKGHGMVQKYTVKLKIDFEENNQGENDKICQTDLTF